VIFIEIALGAATGVVDVEVDVVVVVVVVPDVLPDVVPLVVVPVAPVVVVVGAEAVVVTFLAAPTPGFDVLAAALCVAPLPLVSEPALACDGPLVGFPCVVLPDVLVDWLPLVGAAEFVFGAPPFGALPDLP
jgi:hypothetical protein